MNSRVKIYIRNRAIKQQSRPTTATEQGRKEAKETEYNILNIAFVIKVQNRANLLKPGTPTMD